MARRYTDEEKASVFAILATNDGNVDRTSRDTGVPRATVLSWKNKWEREGATPAVSQAAAEVASDFIAEATVTRFEALKRLRGSLEKASPRDLATVVGILDDKIARAEAIRSGRGNTVEHLHVHALPSPEELGPIMGDYLMRAVGAARRRDAAIIEVPEEPAVKALPRGRD